MSVGAGVVGREACLIEVIQVGLGLGWQELMIMSLAWDENEGADLCSSGAPTSL